MCQARTDGSPQSLHEKFCSATHGVPCKAAHAISKLFNLIIGRQPKSDCCSGPGQKTNCGCKAE